MQIEQQTCQECGSQDMRNILLPTHEGPMTVYVRCLRCESLVARYRLSDYYHQGKAMESFLLSLGSRAAESGRNYVAEVKRIQLEAEQGFAEALLELNQDEKGDSA